MAQPIKILIVDDHPFFRQGVRIFLDSLDEIELVGEADNGQQALEVAAQHQADVVLMDLHMPEMDGICTTKALLKENPSLRILILTSFGDAEKIHQAIAAGASGYCLKDAPPGELLTAINAVAGGGTYLGRGVMPMALAPTVAPKSAARAVDQTNAQDLLAELTQREREVLDKLSQGLSNKEIASELFLGEKTVKTHVANILHKLGVKTRTQAALLATQHNKQGRAL